MKKSTFKRIICMLIVMALIITTLSACGKSTTTSEVVSYNEEDEGDVDNRKTGTDTESDSTTTGNVETGKKGGTSSRTEFLKSMPEKFKNQKFTIFLWEDLKNGQYGNAIRDFEKKTGVSVVTEIANKDEYSTQLAAKIASGKSPDLFRLIYNNMDVMKNIQPLTSTGYDFSDDAWDKEIMKNFTFNGKCYGVNVKDTLSRNMLILLYNKKALKKADMKDPYTIWKNNKNDWTWSKFWSMCDEFVKVNGNKEGYYGVTSGIEDAYLRCFDAGLFDYDEDQGKWVSYIKNPNSVARYEELMTNIDKKLATSIFDKNAFVMGNVLFNFSFSSAMEKTQTSYSQLEGNLGCVPMPTDSTHQPLFEFMAYGVPIGAKNAGIVPYFLRYVFDPSAYDADTFYKDKQASEVIQYMTKITKTSNCHGYRYDVWKDLTTNGASQVRSVLDSYAGDIQSYCDELNAVIPTLHQ